MGQVSWLLLLSAGRVSVLCGEVECLSEVTTAAGEMLHVIHSCEELVLKLSEESGGICCVEEDKSF